jgi:hypothetical protein
LTCNYPDFAPVIVFSHSLVSCDLLTLLDRFLNRHAHGTSTRSLISLVEVTEIPLSYTVRISMNGHCVKPKRKTCKPIPWRNLLLTRWCRALQYWRCTQQVPYDQVAQCVIDNSQKIDWLGILKLPYHGASSCSTPAYWIVVQVGSILTSLLGVVISTLLAPHAKKLWNKIRKKTDNKLPKEIWALPDEYILRASDLLASVGGDLLAIFLSIIVMRQSGLCIFGIAIMVHNSLTVCRRRCIPIN